MSSFTITAPPETDVWRKPPNTERFNAVTHALLPKAVPMSSFQSARVSFSAHWIARYDQGGLMLLLKKDGQKDRWFKAGCEYYMDRPYLASVACHTWADWALTPPAAESGDVFTIEVRREGDELGSSLWLYQLLLKSDGSVKERIPLREVTWMFAEEEGWTVEVSAMACRPAKADAVPGKDKDLKVNFSNAQVDVKQ